jgi:hypothetical protein
MTKNVRKSTEIARGAELHSETEPIVIASSKRDETAVAVIQMEVSSEVRWVGFPMETAVLPPLLIRQKLDRHRDFLPLGVAKVLTFAHEPNSRFCWRFWFAKVLCKSSFFCKDFCHGRE